MRKFEKDGKINFVDDNNKVVGTDLNAYEITDFKYSITNKDGKKVDDYEEFNFTDESIDKKNISEYQYSETFKLKNESGKELLLTLYAEYKGWYTIEFENNIEQTKERK